MNTYSPSADEAKPETGQAVFIAVIRTLVVLAALSLHALLTLEVFTEPQGFLFYTLLLLVYLYFEARRLSRRDGQLFWMNPVILATIYTFVMGVGITNALYFLPDELKAKAGETTITHWTNQLMLLVVLAATAMWIGYSSDIGRGLGRTLKQNRTLQRWMSTSVRLNMPAVYVCIAISLIARLLQVKLGLFGIGMSFELAPATDAYYQYLVFGATLGKLALVGITIQCFASPQYVLGDRQLLWIVLGYEVIFGFLSGMKSGVVMPFVIVGFGYYSQRGHFPRWLIPMISVAVIVAYSVIEPFRAASRQDKDFRGTNLDSVATTMVGAKADYTDVNATPTWLAFLTRMNMVSTAAPGIEFAAKDKLPANSPEFLKDIILAPAYAVVPRVFWKTKPSGELGRWYNREVMEHEYDCAIGMSPFTYLNFAGGPLAVIFGFTIVGIGQRGLFDGLRYFGSGGLIVLFGVLGSLSAIDSTFSAIFINVARYFFMLVAAQFLLLQRQHA